PQRRGARAPAARDGGDRARPAGRSFRARSTAGQLRAGDIGAVCSPETWECPLRVGIGEILALAASRPNPQVAQPGCAQQGNGTPRGGAVRYLRGRFPHQHTERPARWPRLDSPVRSQRGAHDLEAAEPDRVPVVAARPPRARVAETAPLRGPDLHTATTDPRRF